MQYTRDALRQISAAAHAAAEDGALRHAPAWSENQRRAFDRALRRFREQNIAPDPRKAEAPAEDAG
jgi:hypothetical protein